MAILEYCAGCGAHPGENHGEDCDHAPCPDCGEQLLLHECAFWPVDATGPDRPARWSGVDPRDEIARAQDWWTTAVGLDYLVEDYDRVLCAIALGQIAWDQREQHYTVINIDEAALNLAIAADR